MSLRTLEEKTPATAVIVGAGYIGLEMADALTNRGLHVIQMEQLPEVLPTVDPALGQLVHAQLAERGVEVLTGTTVRQITPAGPGEGGRLQVEATIADGPAVTRVADMVLVVFGVRPDAALAATMPANDGRHHRNGFRDDEGRAGGRGRTSWAERSRQARPGTDRAYGRAWLPGPAQPAAA